MTIYAPLDVRVVTPRLELRGATDDLLAALAPAVRDGGATADPPPWDDPSSFYETDPDRRVEGWLQGVWRARGRSGPDLWRLPLVAVLDGEPVGMQDLIGEDFNTFGSVESSSWISADVRERGMGTECRSAILHLAFEGFGAREATSEAAADNAPSNRISQRLGYEPNGCSWATHRGEPVLGQRWRLLRAAWEQRRRDDIELHGVEACMRSFGVERDRPPVRSIAGEGVGDAVEEAP